MCWDVHGMTFSNDSCWCPTQVSICILSAQGLMVVMDRLAAGKLPCCTSRPCEMSVTLCLPSRHTSLNPPVVPPPATPCCGCCASPPHPGLWRSAHMPAAPSLARDCTMGPAHRELTQGGSDARDQEVAILGVIGNMRNPAGGGSNRIVKQVAMGCDV